MAQSSRTFRIFVSSTFSDLKAERNALQEQVFPHLRDLAAAHGCRFQAIDLRWGVSEEAALDQQTMKICLGEIERCQKTSPRPNFIVLLGDRYGWRPLPSEIPADEFEKIIPLIGREEKTLLEQWYRRDDNAIPATYCLQPRSGEFVAYENWEKVETKLRRVFLSAAGRLSLSPDALLKYSASATEQEIVAGALKVPDASEHVFCFLRDIEGLPDDGSVASFRETDPEAAQKQMELKERLKEQLLGNVHEYSARWQGDGPSLEHLDQLCEDVYSELSKVILAEVGLLETVEPLEREISVHEVFGKERARVFIGRADILNAIEKYIAGSDPHPLAVWGASGSGKSALMAKAVEQAQKSGQDVLYRFIGATPESSNGRALLESLCRQVSRRYGADESTMPSEYNDLVQEFLKCLALATPEKPLVIFLDALDQLSDTDNARSLIWLPSDLPANVCLIISTLPGECLKALEGKMPEQSRLEVQPMSVEEGKNILTEWLSGGNRQLEKKQEEHLLGKFQQCGLPLYLKLAFEEARLWKSFDTLPELSDDIPGILRDLFKRLSLESNHGGMLVSRSLGYLAATKNGLSEAELLDVLSLDKEMLADFQRRSPKSPKSDRLPVVVWSRLFFDLEPYLAERAADGISLLAFYHRQMAEAVNAEYLFKEAETKRHQLLAIYFGKQPLQIERTDVINLNLRKINELPWQLACAGSWQELYVVLAELPFLEAAWKIAPFDVKAYWAQIENKSKLRMVEAYHSIISMPSQAGENAWVVSQLLVDTGHLIEALPLREQLAVQYRQEGDILNLAIALGNQANILYLQSKLDAALSLHKEAEVIFRRLNNNDALQRTLSSEASILKDKGEPSQALELYHQAEQICRETGNRVSLWYKLNNMAGILVDQVKLTEALNFYKESEQLCRELNLQDGLANALAGQGVVQYCLGNLDRALELHKEQENISRKISNMRELRNSLNQQAKILANLGKADEALDLLGEQERICQAMENRRGLLDVRGARAMILHLHHHSTETIQILREVELGYRELGIWIEVQGNLRNQAIVFSDNNDLKSALARLEQAKNICRKLDRQDLLKQVLEQETRILGEHGKLREAIVAHEEQERIFRASGDKAGLAASIAAQGQILAVQNEHKRALQKFREQEHICRELRDQNGLAEALHNQGFSLRELRDYKKAEVVIKEQEHLCRETGNYPGLQSAAGNMAGILISRRKYKEAMVLLKEQEHICRDHNIQTGLMMALGDQSNILSWNGQLQPALELQNQVEQLSRKLDDKQQLATSLANQAMILIQIHQSNKAWQKIETAQKLAHENGLLALEQMIRDAMNWMRTHER